MARMTLRRVMPELRDQGLIKIISDKASYVR